MKNQRYCSNFWFIYSVCLFVCRWNAVNNFVSIPNIQFNFLVNFAMNCSSLFDTTLFSNLCNFYILSLNNLTSLSTNVPSVVAIKCVILNNLLQTTRITFFPATTSSFVMKSTVSLAPHSTSVSLLPLLSCSSSSDTYYILLHISPHLLLLLATNNSLWPTLLFSIYFSYWYIMV